MSESENEKSAENRRLVNMQELSVVIKKSTTTIHADIKRWPDFPIVTRGGNGVAYVFDLDEVIPFYKRKEAEKEEAEKKRAETISLWAEKQFGAEEAKFAEMTPTDRLRWEQAVQAADLNRMRRKELLPRAETADMVTNALVKLRQALLQIPLEFAKSQALDREARIELEDLIVQRIDVCAREMSIPEAHRDAAQPEGA